MSIFAEAAAVIGGLLGLGGQAGGMSMDLHGFTNSQAYAVHMPASALSMFGSGVSVAGPAFAACYYTARLASAQAQVTKSVTSAREVAGSEAQQAITDYQVAAAELDSGERFLSVILCAMSFVQSLELMAGFGSPDDGGGLDVGAAGFAGVDEVLAVELAGLSWEGSAAKGWGGHNTALRVAAVSIAQADRSLADVVRCQGQSVDCARLVLGLDATLLGLALCVELVLLTSPGVGPAWARWFAMVAAGLGVAAAGATVITVFGLSIHNAGSAKALADEYGRVAAGVVVSEG